MNIIASWGVNEWVAVGSAVFAFLSFFANLAVVHRQGELQFESLKAQTDAEIMHWAHEAIDLISEAALLARGRGTVFASDEFRRKQLEIAQRLSAMGDRGRLFFPNQGDRSHGAEKEAAFQGFRPPILDTVIFAFYQVERLAPSEPGADDEAAAYLTKCRRLLVSEVQGAVDPARRGRMLQRLARGKISQGVSSFASAADLGETLEARYPGVLIQRRDGAWILAREKQARRG